MYNRNNFQDTKKSKFNMSVIYLLRIHDHLVSAEINFQNRDYEGYFKRLNGLRKEIEPKMQFKEIEINKTFRSNLVKYRQKVEKYTDADNRQIIKFPKGYIAYLQRYECFLRMVMDVHDLLCPDVEIEDPAISATRGGG